MRSRHGVSCDANGAFIGATPLLKRSSSNGRDKWEPRDCDRLSKQIGSQLGLPIDMASKMGGLRAISNALNDGNVARAQIATVLLAIPDPPPLVKGTRPREALIKFVRDLHWSGMIKWGGDKPIRPSQSVTESNSSALREIGGGLTKTGYNPDEPRDELGQWTNGNGNDGSIAGADASERSGEGAPDSAIYRPGSDLEPATIQVAAEWPSNGPPDEAAVCARFARLCVLLAPLLLSGDTPQHVQLHDHHIFPQQFRQYFKQRGIDIDHYTVTMDAPTHLEGVHGVGIDGMPGQWNRAWADFIARNPTATRQHPTATRQQIFDFAGELMKRYGISSSEIHPYGQLP